MSASALAPDATVTVVSPLRPSLVTACNRSKEPAVLSGTIELVAEELERAESTVEEVDASRSATGPSVEA